MAISFFKTKGITCERKSIPAISGRRFSQKLLLSLVFSMLFLVHFSQFVHAYTDQEVQDFLASHPAPAGCNNWTEAYISDGLKGIKIWRRCAGTAVAYTEFWMGGTISVANAPSCYTYRCDGSGTTLSNDFWWTGACIGPLVSAVKIDYSWSVTHYCDGKVVTSPTQTGDFCTPGIGCTYGVSSPCNQKTSGTPDLNSELCRSFDTLLADFFPIIECRGPCCKNPCCEDLCCEQGGSGSAATAGGPQ